MTIAISISFDPATDGAYLGPCLCNLLGFQSGESELVSTIQHLGDQMTKEMQTLTDQVKNNTDVIEGAAVLIKGLATQIEANKTDPAALQALADTLKAEDDTLAAAVAANTPADE
jgi:hypothetical protein